MEQKLKQRLVGAIVLISIAVIFIPIILEGPDEEWTPRNHSIPKPPQMDYGAPLALPVPAGEPAAVKPAQAEVAVTADDEVEAATGEEAEIAAAVEANAAAGQTEPAAAPAPTVEADSPPQQAEITATIPQEAPPEPDSTPEIPAGGWLVQVGSFSSERNASLLRDRLQSSGYDAALLEVAVGQGITYRVVVGPLQERKAAEQLRDRLENEMQLRGIVVENKG